MRPHVPLLLAATACSEPADSRPPDAVPGAAGDTAAWVTEEDAGSMDEAGLEDWIFARDAIHDVEITLPDASWDALLADPYAYAAGDVSYDGVTLERVGVRLRGKIGSFRALTDKPKFKIEFDAYVEDQRFYGLRQLSLNNSVVDCSYLKEPLGYRVFEVAGVPALRTAHARVRVNGADYGLYIVVETPNRDFLARVYPDPGGNLYDGKYVWYDDGSYQLLDFASGVDHLYQLEEGTDVGNADITAVSSAVTAFAGTPDWYAGTGVVVDWPALHRMLAAEQWVGHNDGYALNTNNYRVYFDPADGSAEGVPWDLDYAFLEDSQWGLSWASPRGKLAYHCFTDATCAAAHRRVVSEVLAAVDTADLGALLEELDALTAEAAAADPRSACAPSDVTSWRDGLRSWIAGRSAAVRAHWGVE